MGSWHPKFTFAVTVSSLRLGIETMQGEEKTLSLKKYIKISRLKNPP